MQQFAKDQVAEIIIQYGMDLSKAYQTTQKEKVWGGIEAQLLRLLDQLELLSIASLSNLTMLSIQQGLDSTFIDKVTEVVLAQTEKKVADREAFKAHEIEPICLLIGGLQISQRLEAKLLGLIIQRFIDSLEEKSLALTEVSRLYLALSRVY